MSQVLDESALVGSEHDALTAIAERLAARIAHACDLVGVRSDLLAWTRAGLTAARHTWNPAEHGAFESYAWALVRRQIRDGCRRGRR